MDDEQHKINLVCNCDQCIGENIREKSLKLYDHLKLIINKHKISSGESIYQVDEININCANFFEELCDIVGYYKSSDDIEIKNTDDEIEVDEIDDKSIEEVEKFEEDQEVEEEMLEVDEEIVKPIFEEDNSIERG